MTKQAPIIELGDILTFGSDPQRYKCVQIAYDEDNGIRMFQIVKWPPEMAVSPNCKITVNMCT